MFYFYFFMSHHARAEYEATSNLSCFCSVGTWSLSPPPPFPPALQFLYLLTDSAQFSPLTDWVIGKTRGKINNNNNNNNKQIMLLLLSIVDKIKRELREVDCVQPLTEISEVVWLRDMRRQLLKSQTTIKSDARRLLHVTSKNKFGDRNKPLKQFTTTQCHVSRF